MLVIKLLKVILAVLLLGCLLKWSYGYYEFVRFVGMIGFGILAYSAYTKSNQLFLLLWGSSAVLINPIFKISLGRELWNIIDVIWALILIISIVLENKFNKKRILN